MTATFLSCVFGSWVGFRIGRWRARRAYYRSLLGRIGESTQ